MFTYQVTLPEVAVPDDYTNYTREVVIKVDYPKANRTDIIVQENIGAGEETYSLDLEKNCDLSIFVNLFDDTPSKSFRQTSGFSCGGVDGVFSVVRTDEVAPPPAPAPEPEPEVEPEPEPEVEPEDDSDVSVADDDRDSRWDNFT